MRGRGRYPRHQRVSPDYPDHLSSVPSPLHRGIERVRSSIASPPVLPSPNGRRVGIRIALALRPTGSFNRPRQPLSRGSGPSRYPAEPLVSYQTNRQLPPQVVRAFGAHSHTVTSPLVSRQTMSLMILSSRSRVRWLVKAIPIGIIPRFGSHYITKRSRKRHGCQKPIVLTHVFWRCTTQLETLRRPDIQAAFRRILDTERIQRNITTSSPIKYIYRAS
jgi:hypothetical protein